MTIRRTAMALLVTVSSIAVAAQEAAPASTLNFVSSDAALQRSFEWAKAQALSYSRPASGNMGSWFEAALPGRDAFCIRDASHQSEGAAALGLRAADETIFRRYADSIASARDWAGYWEINREGLPAKDDYVSDSNFWFNLPANFDALDAVVRAWRWTGDDRYQQDPVFQRLFRATLTDYIRSWQLAPDTILTRPRIANQREASGRFVDARGIPSYTEETTDFIFGTDLLAAEFRAIHAFEQIAVSDADRDLVKESLPMAAKLQAILERVGWSESQHHYLRTIHRDLTGSGSGDALLLYFSAIANDAHQRAALDYVANSQYWRNINIEEESYLPLTFFRYGRAASGYQVIADLSSPQKPRREYPEVSYAVIEAIVSGVMGLLPSEARQPFDVSTLSQLQSGEATLSGVAIRHNLLTVTHTGTSATRLTNTSGPSVRWRARFTGPGQHLLVGHRPAKVERSGGSTTETWVDVSVMPGQSILVQR